VILPPLRHRREDIPELARFFLRTSAVGSRGRLSEIGDDAIGVLVDYPWPGNVRELKNFMERMAISMAGQLISAADVRMYLKQPAAGKRESEVRKLWEIEKQAILAALDRYEGNRTKTAEVLGIGRRTLQNKLKSYGMADYGNSS
jgi:two-component system response regulator HydG